MLNFNHNRRLCELSCSFNAAAKLRKSLTRVAKSSTDLWSLFYGLKVTPVISSGGVLLYIFNIMRVNILLTEFIFGTRSA